ncbi:MAG: putative DNA-binding domain-containing protein [Gammaproteobacteria bacterium]|nr:putative DNA-binding domain-containing protein [Gammaproteobacteria bacterium]
MKTPDFLRLQRQFAVRVRNPAAHQAPEGVPPSRMQVYEDLIRNNVERFLAGAFPIAKKRLGDAPWNALVHAFLDRHGCDSPYFRDIGEEFLAFLQGDAAPEVPNWLPELCHYERVPTLLRRAEAPSPTRPIDPDGDLITQPAAVSPLAWPLSYRYPVHRIRAKSPSGDVAPKPTWLIAWRRGDDSVGVMASNALTHRLLELLRDGNSGQQALDQLAKAFPSANGARIHQEGAAILERLRTAGVLLGTKLQSGTTPAQHGFGRVGSGSV